MNKTRQNGIQHRKKRKKANIIPKQSVILTVPEPTASLKLQVCTASKLTNRQSLVSRLPNEKLDILLFTCITKRI
jgi:hypothetical protein